jgi:hypothetical protein
MDITKSNKQASRTNTFELSVSNLGTADDAG